MNLYIFALQCFEGPKPNLLMPYLSLPLPYPYTLMDTGPTILGPISNERMALFIGLKLR